MKRITLGTSNLTTSQIALGCMRIADLAVKDVEALIDTALSEGIDFFDHADIYGDGESERVFAQAMGSRSSLRDKMILQSKCGIRDGFYDFSKEYIVSSVDGILGRLNTEYIDVLLLHRPDTLMDPEEVADAVNTLMDAGKIRHFGVSNHNPLQIELLLRALDTDIIIDQLQFSIMHTGMVDSGLNVNLRNDNALNRDDSLLEYCRLNSITIQPWSPFQYGFFEGVFLDNDDYPELNAVIDRIARQYGVTNTAVAIAWILRHPATMQPIAGTTNPQRLRDICRACDFELTRPEWYEIYRAAGNLLP